MKCPFCHHGESKVTDSREAHEINATRRRRECSHCSRRFTTFETIDLCLQVKKRDGTFEGFDEDKLMRGLDAACCHTKVSHEKVRTLSSKIKAELMANGVKEITSKELGSMVMQHLQKIDVIACIRFACVYKRFTDVRELVGAIYAIAPENALKNEEKHAAEKK